MTLEELNKLFRSENALVNGEVFTGLVTCTSQACLKDGLANWVSTSLAPQDGWMSYYGVRDPQWLGVATVYDFSSSDHNEYCGHKEHQMYATIIIKQVHNLEKRQYKLTLMRKQFTMTSKV